jgi:crotonobetainyl-CoA:carnitine CoA-transferase CaiB-like acyl-CoA transferase
MTAEPGAYDGLKVVDFSHVVAGPLCTRMLADHGATVIKIERPEGEMCRRFPVAYGPDLSTQFAQFNCGKRSVALDLRAPSALALALELCGRADVVVENFSPGAMERLGLAIPELMRRNPRLIVCSISTFGAFGPWSSISGYGFVAEAYSGLMGMNGDEGEPPSAFGTALADMNAGVHAFAAIGAALHHRASSGRGTHIDISSFDALLSVIDHAIVLHNMTGGKRRFGKYGTRHSMIVPNGTVRTGDGSYVVYGCARDEQFAALSRLMGRPELAEDPRYATAEARIESRDEIYETIEAWAATVATADELVSVLAGAQIVAARVRDYSETAVDPHLIARGTLAPVEIRGIGEVMMPSAPHRMSGLRSAPRGDAPLVGEHTAEVLAQELGVGDARLQELLGEGAVATSGEALR